MRTTLDLDRDLLNRAKAEMNAKTYKETVERSLERAIESAEMSRLIDEIEDSDLVWGLDEMLDYRRLERRGAS